VSVVFEAVAALHCMLAADEHRPASIVGCRPSGQNEELVCILSEVLSWRPPWTLEELVQVIKFERVYIKRFIHES